MALKSTIFKAELQIADMDRHYYQTHALTIARHPSENDERMMARVLAFALHATDRLAFGKGLSTEDEPDIYEEDLTGAIVRWIDVGVPDERRVIRASRRSSSVAIYAYGNGAQPWWKQSGQAFTDLKNVSVSFLPTDQLRDLASLAQRTMQLQLTVQEGQLWISDQARAIQLEPAKWLAAANGAA